MGIRGIATLEAVHGLGGHPGARTTLGIVSVLSTVAALFGMRAAHAQDAAPPSTDSEVSEIVVTGSRIARDGYSAPTPVTVVGSEQLGHQAAPNVINYLDTLPVFSGNLTPASSTGTISTGMAGTSAVNLRDLGVNRTLVLINGRRSVGSTVRGRVDINSIPEQLIDRVEIVTGGASAAYGSDAVAGVVNFILDEDFSGFDAEASGGMTGHSDNRNYDLAMTFGTPFADGRGHFIVSGQNSYQTGILRANMDWVREGWQVIYNPDYTPTNGQPDLLVAPHVAPSTLGPGGLIVSGPLRGVAFGRGGTPFLLDYGPTVSGNAMSGGDYEFTSTRGQTSLEPELSFQNVFARLSYDVTNDLSVFVQSKWNSTENFGYAYPHDIYYGGLVVQADNPFLPESIANQAQALGLETLEIGTSFQDLGTIINDHSRKVLRNVVGFNMLVDAFDTTWTWDGYYQYGVAESSQFARNSANFNHLPLALDAVVDPVTGGIACRSTLTDPGNGCVPLNPFGIGVNTDLAVNYVMGEGHRTERLEQTVVATSIQGDPFSNWAGPVSLAAGIEYREESVEGASSELSRQAVFWGGNYLPTFGKYDVTEGFLETVFPLASDRPWIRSLDLNAAVRLTQYSTSGSIAAWKVGLTYSPTSDLRFRLTQSRDIRAPNLSELYNAGRKNYDGIIDPLTKEGAYYEGLSGGNPDLDPEVADTFGLGVVLQPSFAPGLNASIDYWSIGIEDAIDRYSAQLIADLCYQGDQTFCAAINDGQPLHPASGTNPNRIKLQPFNLAELTARGVDLELGYQLPMTVLDGDLGLRLMATHYLQNEVEDGENAPNDRVGQNGGDDAGPPDWRWTASLTYDRDIFTAVLGARGISAGVLDHDFIECTSSCPTSTPTHRTINTNQIEGATYFDLSLSYRLLAGDRNDVEVETFFNIRNLADEDPAIAPNGPGSSNFNLVPTNTAVYDAQGRVYMFGVRVGL